jgi:hypothetical protein
MENSEYSGVCNWQILPDGWKARSFGVKKVILADQRRIQARFSRESAGVKKRSSSFETLEYSRLSTLKSEFPKISGRRHLPG